MAQTSGGPSTGAEQSGTSCLKVPRATAQRALDAGRASFDDVRVQRACLQTNPLRQGPCRMAPALPGIAHWEFFLVFFHSSLIKVYHARKDGPNGEQKRGSVGGKAKQRLILDGKKGEKIFFFRLDHMCGCGADNSGPKTQAANLP